MFFLLGSIDSSFCGEYSEMSIPSAIVDSSLLDDLGEASLYEDALDDSDEDWKRFHRDALTHMAKVDEMSKHRKPVNLLEASSSRPIIQHQSSSSDHSSIEKVNADCL